MIIRSDWRGEPRNTSAPKRAISKRDADIDIISMAQQAKPNDMGQMEFLRAQLIALPSVVVTMPSESTPSSKPASSMRANKSGGPLASGVSSMILSSHDSALAPSIIEGGLVTWMLPAFGQLAAANPVNVRGPVVFRLPGAGETMPGENDC